MRFLLITDPGLESFVAEELDERCPDARVELRPYGVPRHVAVEIDAGPGALEQLATIHHIVELRHEQRVETLDDIRGIAARIDLPEVQQAATFRVTTERTGDHPFHGVEVQRAVGGALHPRYGTPVDLEHPALVVRADLHGPWLVLGLQRTVRSMSKRIARTRALRTALKPTIAAALLRLSGVHEGRGRWIDPMCGSGTLPIEAARMNPRLEIHAADWDPETVEVARTTLAAHGLVVEPRVADARALGTSDPGRYDFIVTDPPYGLRQARRTSLTRLYTSLLRSFERALAPGGRIAVVVVKHRVLRAAIERTGLEIRAERVVETGGVEPRLLVLSRPEAP